MDTPSNAMTRSVQNPYELILNEYDGCIYLNGSRFVANYTVVDMRNHVTATLTPNVYYIVSPNTAITLEPLQGFINEFVFETTGPVTFTNTILWQGGEAPPSDTGVIQYSIVYNAVTQQYLGSWALYNQPQFVQGAQGAQGVQGVQGAQGVQGVQGIAGVPNAVPIELTVRVNPSGSIINEWVTKTFYVTPDA